MQMDETAHTEFIICNHTIKVRNNLGYLCRIFGIPIGGKYGGHSGTQENAFLGVAAQARRGTAGPRHWTIPIRKPTIDVGATALSLSSSGWLR